MSSRWRESRTQHAGLDDDHRSESTLPQEIDDEPTEACVRILSSQRRKSAGNSHGRDEEEGEDGGGDGQCGEDVVAVVVLFGEREHVGSDAHHDDGEEDGHTYTLRRNNRWSALCIHFSNNMYDSPNVTRRARAKRPMADELHREQTKIRMDVTGIWSEQFVSPRGAASQRPSRV